MVSAGKYNKKYVVIDSAPIDAEKIDLYNWEELEDRFVWFDDEEGYYQFDLIAAKSIDPPSCVRRMNNIYPYLADDEYLQEWRGSYLNDLLDVCEYNFGIKKGHIQLAELIEIHYDSIFEVISYWFEEIDEKDLEYELDNYIFVAEAYQLSIPESKREEALISFCSALIGAMIFG